MSLTSRYKMTLSDLKTMAEDVASQTSHQNLILLNGPMGSGKTQWTRFFVSALGGREVSSPTFTFHQTYLSPRYKIHHFDLYRIESDEDLESIGFWDIFLEKDSIVVVEWAEKAFTTAKDWPRHWKVQCLDLTP